MGDYPTESELKKVELWDFQKESVENFLGFLESIFWTPDWCFEHKGNTLKLHTGGWSGNEEIIDALEKNFIFWTMCWTRTDRGGHYTFKGLGRLNPGKKKELTA